MWKVIRHGGRSGDSWRTVRESADLLALFSAYERELARMRQGGVRLVDPEGGVARAHWAPRLRTRW